MSGSRKVESRVIDPDRFRGAILIVSFRNPQDVQACLTTLSRSTAEPGFDIYVCENGGSESFHELCDALMGPQGPCITVSDDLPDSLASASGRLVEVKCLALKDRPSRVWIGCAAGNLGYAGGINVWIDCCRSRVGRESGFSIRTPSLNP